MLKGKKIIIFGASENGRAACDYLSKDNDILFVCDSNEEKWGKTFGEYRIKSPECISNYKDVYLVVAIVKKYSEVVPFLVNMGVHKIWHFIEYQNLVSGIKEVKLRLMPKDYSFEIDDVDFDKSKKRIENGKCDNKKNILIFANYFPPIGGSGVQRPLKFAKYLRDFGYKPLVVTRGNCDKTLFLDYTLLDELVGVRIIRIQESPQFLEEMSYENYKLLIDLFSAIGLDDSWLREYQKYLNKGEAIPDDEIMWIISCIRSISDVVDLNEISVVYTTIGPYSSALFGAYLKINYNIKWVLDYRDPWCLNEYNMRTFYEFRMMRREYEKNLEICILKLADYVVSVAEVFCKDFRNYYPNVSTICITNGYDEEDFFELSRGKGKSEKFVILFNGYFYPNYDLKLVLEVLNDMIQRGIIKRDMVSYEFNGRNPLEYSGLADLDKYGIVKYNGYLTHRKSIEAICNASVLLLYGLFDEGAYQGYSGKLFEYMRSGTPILSVSSPFGVQHEMIEKHKHGITATLNDREKIERFIYENYIAWENGNGAQEYCPDDYVRSFSREKLTEQLAQVFDEVLSERK